MPFDIRSSGAVPSVLSPDGTASFPLTTASNPFPSGATALQNSSGTVAAAPAVATLTSAVGRTAFLAGLELTASGSTAALTVVATITGLLGGTRSIVFSFPAGVTLEATPKIIVFNPSLQASAVNTNIVVTLPSGGAGNTNAVASANGYMI